MIITFANQTAFGDDHVAPSSMSAAFAPTLLWYMAQLAHPILGLAIACHFDNGQYDENEVVVLDYQERLHSFYQLERFWLTGSTTSSTLVKTVFDLCILTPSGLLRDPCLLPAAPPVLFARSGADRSLDAARSTLRANRPPCCPRLPAALGMCLAILSPRDPRLLQCTEVCPPRAGGLIDSSCRG